MLVHEKVPSAMARATAALWAGLARGARAYHHSYSKGSPKSSTSRGTHPPSQPACSPGKGAAQRSPQDVSSQATGMTPGASCWARGLWHRQTDRQTDVFLCQEAL